MGNEVLKIEVREKGTKAFYKEVVCVIAQYLRLMKKPDRKLQDTFKMLRTYLTICTVLLVIVLAMAIAWGMDALSIAAIALMVAAIALSGIQLYRFSNMVKAYLGDPRASLITLDPSGVELDKEGAQVIRVAWDEVAFVRVFDESVCFFAKGVRGLVIAVNRSREQEILAYLKDNRINVRLIER